MVVAEGSYAPYTKSWRAISNRQGEPILKANKEYATLVDSHIILGRREDLVRAQTEFNSECKSSSSFFGGEPAIPSQVKPVQTVDHIAGRYPNKSVENGERRGLALIISMEKERPGGAADRGRLEVLLKTTLKFDTEIVVDDAEDIKTTVKKLVKIPHLADDDCFLCCINAHGDIEEDGRQYIIVGGAGDKKLKLYVVEDIVKPIAKCEYLQDKPKVFVINACRGSGWLVTSKLAQGSSKGSQVLSKGAGDKPRLLYEVKDCLVVFSTSHGEESSRDPQNGTTFIEAFWTAIVEGCQTTDLQSILTSVIGKVTEKEVWQGSEKRFQCPEFSSSLTKGLYWS